MSDKRKKVKSKSNFPKIIAAIILSVFFIALILILARVLLNKNDSTEIYRVKKEVSEDVIEIAGNISAANEQSLQALDDGKVTGVYVSEGQHVKKGQLILQLDDTTQQDNLANLDYYIEQKKVTGSVKELELLYVQRKSLVQKVKDRQIVATFDGIIVDLDIAVGDYLEAKDSIGTLVDLSYLKAEVEIAETDVSRLVSGQTVEFTFPAYDGTVDGYLVGYPAIGEITSRGATVVNAVARIDDYPEEILPNYSFTGKIRLSDPEELLLVDRMAIGYDNGKAYVEKMSRSGESEKIYVEVSPYGSSYVTILSGLEEGDMLKQLQKSSISGRFRNNKQNNKNKKESNSDMMGPPPGMGGGGGMPGM
ncbi:MAG: HlyD family efflux transporter periplasmic adaptor subunit [Treponema sp.]|nr:HlyD family efflux transporter periplasmic adaptor subunit [Treponema sp.]